ncbi:MAG: LamG-like jellyroll fold domain-containing protein [Planctomycetota bacterium]
MGYRIKPKDRKPAITGEQLTSVSATASSSQPQAQVAHLLDNSGLLHADGDRLLEHSANAENMWMSEKGQTSGWVEFDLGQVHKLGTIKVWNFNEKWQTDRGVKKADISVWTENAGWKKTLDDFEFEQAEGRADYDEPAVLQLNRIEARKVRFDDLVNLGDPEYVGLSEVQFFKLRGPRASRPQPPDGADFGAAPGAKLTWVPGLDVKRYKVYFGADPNKLKLVGKVKDPSFARLPPLRRHEHYYWRIDSLTKSGDLVKGNLWSFCPGQLVGWWKFDETAGATASDSSGKNHHGAAVSGEPVWDSHGKFGGCAYFNETYGFAIPRDVFANVSGGLTISVWLKADANQPAHSNVILQAGAGETGKPYILTLGTDWKDNGELRFKTGHEGRDDVRYNAAPDQWAGKWDHYIFVKDADAGLQRIYLNGKMVAEKTEATAPMTGIDCARIGIAPDRFGDQYIGRLDDLRIYSYALSADDAAALYAGKEPSPVVGPYITAGAPTTPRARNLTAVLVIFAVAIIAVVFATRAKRKTA